MSLLKTLIFAAVVTLVTSQDFASLFAPLLGAAQGGGGGGANNFGNLFSAFQGIGGLLQNHQGFGAPQPAPAPAPAPDPAPAPAPAPPPAAGAAPPPASAPNQPGPTPEAADYD